MAYQGSEGPWFNSNLEPSLSLPSTPPSLLLLPCPFSSPFPPLLQPSPSPCRDAAFQIQLGGLGERCKLPQRGLVRSPADIEFGAFYALCSLLLRFFRSRPIIFLPKVFLWSHYSGVPGARGTRFIEPPEAPVPTPLRLTLAQRASIRPTDCGTIS